MEYYLSKSLGIINLRTNCEEKPCSILQLGLFVTKSIINLHVQHVHVQSRLMAFDLRNP